MLTIGLMSGTSMDGIDAAFLLTDGESLIREFPLGHSHFPYASEFKLLLKAAEYSVKQTAGDLTKAAQCYPTDIPVYLQQQLNLPAAQAESKFTLLRNYLAEHDLALSLNDVIKHATLLHANAVRQLIKKCQCTAEDITVIGFHGQTLYHAPDKRMTVQVGDGELLARLTGIAVVNDFRANDVACGGQGAPFAPLYHRALVLRDQFPLPAAVINCGGIANITFMPDKELNSLTGFDTGPGNCLIDHFIRLMTQGQENMDRDGIYGMQGQVQPLQLEHLYQQALPPGFLQQAPPKSLDYNDMSLPLGFKAFAHEHVYDACRTLEAFTGDCIVKGFDWLNAAPRSCILAGGGWNNPVIRDEFSSRLRTRFPQVKIAAAAEVGWQNQAIEAQLMAYLAARTLQGLPISFPGTTRAPHALTGGRVWGKIKVSSLRVCTPEATQG